MPVHRRAAVAIALLALLSLGACAPAAEPAAFTLSSPDIDAEGYVSEAQTGNVAPYCDGDNVSPLLEWTGAPEATESFVLLMTDPNYAEYDHWVVTGIPGDATALPATPNGAVGLGTVGANSRGEGDYVGPCQPDNGYRYTLYALDSVVEGDATTTVAEAKELIEGHVLDEAFVEAMRH